MPFDYLRDTGKDILGSHEIRLQDQSQKGSGSSFLGLEKRKRITEVEYQHQVILAYPEKSQLSINGSV